MGEGRRWKKEKTMAEGLKNIPRSDGTASGLVAKFSYQFAPMCVQ